MTGLRDRRGFTLMELLVAMGITLVVMVGGVVLLRQQLLGARVQMAQTDVDDAARAAVELMAREIRIAGYNPRCILTPPPVVAIVSAAPQLLRVQYDLNENGALDAASEDITYQYDATNNKVQRVLNGVTSDIATDVPTAGFALRYYQSNGTEIVGSGAGGTLTAAEMAAVYNVSILLQPSKAADPRTTTTVNADLWTNVLLRNRYYPCV